MPTQFPVNLDNFANPAANTSQNVARTHSQQHGDLNDAVEALQAKVGINNSADTESLDHLARQAAGVRDDLASPDAGKGAALVSFKQVGAAAMSRNMLDKAREQVSVRDFMTPEQIADTMLANPVLDHTAAIQAAAAACATGGADSRLYFPKGTYNLSAEVNITFSGMVYGAGAEDTIIRATVAGINHFTTVGSFGRVTFQDMQLGTTVTKTGGAGIFINTTTPTDGAQSGARIYNVRTIDLWDGFKALNAAYWVIDSCTLFGTLNDAIYSDCTSNFDAGDNTVINCTIAGAGFAGNGIRLVNNCRAINNKVLNHAVGILVQPTTVAGTRVDFQVIGNSVENQGTHGIRFIVNAAGTGVANSIIGQNQLTAFANNSQCIAINGPVGGLSINNNVCVLSGTETVGIATVANGTGAPGTIVINDNLVTGGPVGSIGIYAGSTNTLVHSNLVASASTKYTSADAGVTFYNTPFTFATLPSSVANGSVVYCSDGTVANPVAGGGTGCIAKRLNGVWVGN